METLIEIIKGGEGRALEELANSFGKTVDIKDVLKEWDKSIPRDVFMKAGKLGFLGLHHREEWGGSGEGHKGNTVLIATLQETLSKYNPDLALAIQVSAGLAGESIEISGSRVQKARYLKDIVSGKSICCFALTGPESGSYPGMTNSKVTYENGKLILNGDKKFITLGSQSEFAVFFAKSHVGGKLTAYLVPLLGEDSKSANIDAYEAANSSNLSIVGRVLGEDSILGGENGSYVDNGNKLWREIISYGRLYIAAHASGMMERAIQESAEYAKTRMTKGGMLIDQQLIRGMLADMKISHEASRSMVYKAAWEADRNGLMDEHDAALVKIFATDAAEKVFGMGVDIHGGAGCSLDSPIRYLERIGKILQTFEGHNIALRNFLGGAL
ncbi:acyl-CoA/acyl-ACP dehydrogenase [Candidatus Woesearchaeota archaeon]|nr:acyl-CoA/acyl-ACP dehydrogenase [Candidatus Woesearchaeota archaeon]